jgi:tetratricopeptide (TPR) repeat protein
MKALVFAILLAASFTRMSGQTIADSALYGFGIRLIEGASDTQDYEAAAGYFRQISADNPHQWLACYYEALCFIHAGHAMPDAKTKDTLLDTAQVILNKAFALNPDESELYVLQAFIYQTKIEVNPELRGMTYSRKAETNLKKALELNAVNPRAHMLMAYNTFYTPVLFGGGAEKALPGFQKASRLYLEFKPELPFSPQWGEQENQEMIAAYEKAKNKSNKM